MSRVVVHGGTVITCNAAGQVGEAVCFDEAEGQIIAVGTQAQVQAAAGDGAREVDVEGATVLPGLIDTHPHLMHFGVLAEPLVDLSNAVDHTDIVTASPPRPATRRQASGSSPRRSETPTTSSAVHSATWRKASCPPATRSTAPPHGLPAPGHHADLCIIDRNPLRCSVDALPATRVHATVLAGRPVHGTL